MKRSPYTRFYPGDLVEIKGVEYPPAGRIVRRWVGLYSDVGYPQTYRHGNAASVLNDRLCATVENGQRAIVIAVVWNYYDERWYYMLRCTNGGSIGWTRAKARLFHVA